MTIWLKKLLGTSTLILALAAGYFSYTQGALAQFIDPRGSLIADGVVASVTGNDIVFLTHGSAPITLITNRQTLFAGGKTLNDYQPGSAIHVIGRDTHNGVLARIIQPRTGSNYGTTGDIVMALQGTVTAKTSSSLTIQTDSARITFQVSSSTDFFRTNFSQLMIGDRVQVFGQDTGSSFAATFVLKR
jgi:hypothetical protein